MFRNLSVGSRLTLIITFVVILILIAVTFIETNSANTALYAQTRSSFISKTEQIRQELNTDFTALSSLATDFASDVSAMGNINDSSALRGVVQDFANTSGSRLAIRYGVSRPDGNAGVLSLSNPLLPANDNTIWRVYTQPKDKLSDPRFAQVVTTARSTTNRSNIKPTWILQDVALYDEQKQPSATVVMPYIYNGTIAGYVWVEVSQSQIQQRITDYLNEYGLLFSTNGGYTLLVDARQVLISTHNLRRSGLRSGVELNASGTPVPSQSTLLEQDLASLLTNSDPKSGDILELQDPLTGENVMAVLFTFKDSGWRFVSTFPISEVPSVPSTIFGPVIIISASGVIILIALINGFTQNAISEPLKRLGTSAGEIGAGDFRYYIPYRDRRDEVGILGQALEDMRVSLEHSYDELSRWSRTLEKRVIDRTKEADTERQKAIASAKELQAIYNESLLVVNETQLKPILDALTKRLPSLLNSTYVAVWLATEERDRLQLVATNESRQREGIIIKNGEGIAGQCMQQARPIILDDYKAYEHSITLVGFGKDAPFDRAMSVPLIYVGRPIGAIVVGRLMSSVGYNDEDQRLLTLFANIVSPTVRNAQLFVRMNEAIDEAERANQVKTRFLASVTHELRTPLNLIINNMDFMRIGAFGEVNKEQASRLGQTVRSAEHLLYLINDLLDVSKIEAGEMQLFMQDNDVEVMLDDSIDNTVAFMDKIDGKTDDVEFVVDIEEELPKIPMDVRRVRQVLTNLLTNAVKFTDKGTVSLKVRKMSDGIEFSVTDTGMGIPPDEADKLFQAFERTSNAKAHNIEGTGLGLPISKFLVEQHGGQLTFTSEVGKGTTFTFTLPFKQQPEEPVSVTDSGIFRRSDPTIAAILQSTNE
jgi:signal transduction histidine kinase/HAMP domain-containing protein